ncbi:hypothetical protein D3C78_1711540 [compost metagenome]
MRLQLQGGQTLGDGQQLLTDLGQLDASATAMEQLDVVLALKALHLGGQRRLAESEGACTGTETAMPGHGEEGA